MSVDLPASSQSCSPLSAQLQACYGRCFRGKSKKRVPGSKDPCFRLRNSRFLEGLTSMASISSVSRSRSPLARSSGSARRRYSENIYFQDGAVLTGTLLALIYLVLATSLD